MRGVDLFLRKFPPSPGGGGSGVRVKVVTVAALEEGGGGGDDDAGKEEVRTVVPRRGEGGPAPPPDGGDSRPRPAPEVVGRGCAAAVIVGGGGGGGNAPSRPPGGEGVVPNGGETIEVEEADYLHDSKKTNIASTSPRGHEPAVVDTADLAPPSEGTRGGASSSSSSSRKQRSRDHPKSAVRDVPSPVSVIEPLGTRTTTTTRRSCAWCGLGGSSNAKAAKKLMVCSGCQSTYYCGPVCQTRGWIDGGHGETCRRLASSSARRSDEDGPREEEEEDRRGIIDKDDGGILRGVSVVVISSKNQSDGKHIS
jgi:hypothetical protein